jgi:hypothetical protein
MERTTNSSIFSTQSMVSCSSRKPFWTPPATNKKVHVCSKVMWRQWGKKNIISKTRSRGLHLRDNRNSSTLYIFPKSSYGVCNVPDLEPFVIVCIGGWVDWYPSVNVMYIYCGHPFTPWFQCCTHLSSAWRIVNKYKVFTVYVVHTSG